LRQCVLYVFVSMFLDVLQNGWKRGGTFAGEELEGLADKVPEILENSRATNTSKVYQASFNRWERWTSKYPEIDALPAQPNHVILYITHLAEKAGSFSSINQFLSALSWAHNLQGLASPVKDPVVTEVINGIKRKLACPTLRKEPFSADNMKNLVLLMRPVSLTDVRNTTLMVIAFVAFLRFEEVTNIRIQDITFHAEHVEINIPKAKTDQLRQGNSLVIASTGGVTCPVTLLARYMKMAGLKQQKHNSSFLFTRIIFKNKKLQLFHANKPMSYSNVRDMVKVKAQQLGLDPKSFSTHSMRSGGATAAAAAGTDERLMQKHGRWAVSSSKDRYIVDALDKRLEVSKRLLK
jgi:site-specific recombinase XerD